MKNKDDLLVDMLSLLWKGGVAVYQTFAGSKEEGQAARESAKKEFEKKSAEWEKTKEEFEKIKREKNRN